MLELEVGIKQLAGTRKFGGEDLWDPRDEGDYSRWSVAELG